MYLACALLSDKGFKVDFREDTIVITRKESEEVVIDKGTANFILVSSSEFHNAVLKQLLPGVGVAGDILDKQ